MAQKFATQRNPHRGNLRGDDARAAVVDLPSDPLANQAILLGELDPDLYDEPMHLVPIDPRVDLVRSASLLQSAQEIGHWSLEYLGPGFHVQLRIVRHHRQARLDGWMSPARPITVLLASMLRKPVILESRVSDSGRFEFPVAPTGACRMSFIVDDGGRPPATPPFWV